MAKGNMSVFGINNRNYLGIRDDNTITGISVRDEAVTKEDFAAYLKNKQVDELMNLEIGASTEVIYRKLTKHEKVVFDAVKAEYKMAEEISGGWLINQVFDDVRGKK